MKPPEPDAAFEISLRPPAFSEFNGQVKVRERLELMVEAAKKRSDVLEHILLSGPSGLGKTTLAYIIAKQGGRVALPKFESALQSPAAKHIAGRVPDLRSARLDPSSRWPPPQM